jgi:alkylated DNA repair protein (DNA oxidative demethylase)
MPREPLFGRSGDRNRVALTEGAWLLPGFVRVDGERLLEEVSSIAAAAPFRHMTTPGGYRMSAAMTGCGTVSWVTDPNGYRYDRNDPESGRAWPPLPRVFGQLASRAAAACGFEEFRPDACLINRYEPGARMTLHQDKDERDLSQPIVSVSLGLPQVFLLGGARRVQRPLHVELRHGDVVVWGGPARLFYHGVQPLHAGCDPLTGAYRINLTFRKAL